MPDGVVVTVIKAFILVNGLMGFFAFMTVFERKLIGRLQTRHGPNRVGPMGLLQPIADRGMRVNGCPEHRGRHTGDHHVRHGNYA